MGIISLWFTNLYSRRFTGLGNFVRQHTRQHTRIYIYIYMYKIECTYTRMRSVYTHSKQLLADSVQLLGIMCSQHSLQVQHESSLFTVSMAFSSYRTATKRNNLFQTFVLHVFCNIAWDLSANNCLLCIYMRVCWRTKLPNPVNLLEYNSMILYPLFCVKKQKTTTCDYMYMYSATASILYI